LVSSTKLAVCGGDKDALLFFDVNMAIGFRGCRQVISAQPLALTT